MLKTSFLAAAILFTLCFFVFDTSAQTHKRRRKVKKTPVAVKPRVQPAVSQNAGYIDGNQIVLGEIPQPPTTDSATETENPAPVGDGGDRDVQIKELSDRIKSLETSGRSKDAKQKTLLLNLDILTRAESRAESLRKQLYEIIEKESNIKARLDQIQIDSRSDVIDRSVAMMGSLRPEELRDQRHKSLEAEKNNLETLLTQIQTNHAALQSNVERADALVEKIRTKLDKEIDDALTDDKDN